MSAIQYRPDFGPAGNCLLDEVVQGLSAIHPKYKLKQDQFFFSVENSSDLSMEVFARIVQRKNDHWSLVPLSATDIKSFKITYLKDGNIYLVAGVLYCSTK